MVKAFFLCIAFLAFSEVVVGQPRATLYFNDYLELTKSRTFSIRREVGIDPKEMTFHGSFKDFDQDGVLIGEGHYTHGAKSGKHYVYKGNELKSVVEYLPEGFIIWELKGVDERYSVHEGTGKFKMQFNYFENSFEIGVRESGTVRGEFDHGKRVGEWFYETAGRKINYVEKYDQGSLVVRTGNGPEGSREFQTVMAIFFAPVSDKIEKFDYDKRRFNNLFEYFEHHPITHADSIHWNVNYPGGISAMMKVIQDGVKFPNEEGSDQISGMVVVLITVDRHGKIKEKKVIQQLDPGFDAEVLKAIDLVADRIIPANSGGKTHEASIRIPVKFQLSQ